jgi:hypothetical protein
MRGPAGGGVAPCVHMTCTCQCLIVVIARALSMPPGRGVVLTDLQSSIVSMNFSLSLSLSLLSHLSLLVVTARALSLLFASGNMHNGTSLTSAGG